MKAMLAVAIAAILTGCATAKWDQSPKLADFERRCRIDGHTMRTLGACIESSLDRTYQAWRTSDQDSGAVVWYVNTLKILGEKVSSGEMSEYQAQQLASEEITQLRARKQIATMNQQQDRARTSAEIAEAVSTAAVAVSAGAALASRPARPAPQTCTIMRFGNGYQQVCN